MKIFRSIYNITRAAIGLTYSYLVKPLFRLLKALVMPLAIVGSALAIGGFILLKKLGLDKPVDEVNTNSDSKKRQKPTIVRRESAALRNISTNTKKMQADSHDEGATHFRKPRKKTQKRDDKPSAAPKPRI